MGNHICARRTFTNSSVNLNDGKSVGRQSDELKQKCSINKISVTIHDIALYIKHNRNLDGRINNLFFLIDSENNLVSTWSDIKNNPDMLTSGGDSKNETLNYLPINWFTKISFNLLNGIHNYKCARGIKIFKSKGVHVL